MIDEDIRRHINDLAHEEEALWHEASLDGLAPAQFERLRQIKIELDRSWDLLHQREALRSAGLDPDHAAARSADTVEHYEQ